MNQGAQINKEFKEFFPYLEDVDIKTDLLFERIRAIYNLCSYMCPDGIEDIFVTDYYKADGTREYESIWFFSDNYCLEAKNFFTKFDLDITPIKNNIARWRVLALEFDFKTTSIKSRLNLDFSTRMDTFGNLKAANNNCAYLQDIINKYIKINIVSPGSSLLV